MAEAREARAARAEERASSPTPADTRGIGLRPLLWCLGAAVLFGASTPASKHVLSGLGPLTVAGLLYLGAALGVAPVALRGRSPWRADPRNHRLLFGAVFFGGVAGPILMLMGLMRAPAASVSLWLNLESVATALLGWALFKEQIGKRTAASLAVVVVASLLLAAPGGALLAPAALLVALAAICWGLDNNLTALIDGLTPAQSTFAKGVVAGMVNLGLGLAVEGVVPGAALVLFALGIGTLGYGVSIALYIAGAQHLGATRAQLVFATAPYFGVALSWGALGEPVLGAQVAAVVLMLLSLWILRREDHGHPHSHDAITHVHWHRHEDGHHDHEHPDGTPGVEWHNHEHAHEPVTHQHPHRPDLHHRHDHA